MLWSYGTFKVFRMRFYIKKFFVLKDTKSSLIKKAKSSKAGDNQV